MKIAILGSYSTQFFVKELKMLVSNKDAIYESDYSQIDNQILNSKSDLYLFKPDYIFIHETVISYKRKFNSIDSLQEIFYKESIERLNNLIKKVSIILPNV